MASSHNNSNNTAMDLQHTAASRTDSRAMINTSNNKGEFFPSQYYLEKCS